MERSGKRFVYVITGWQERPASPERPAVWRFSLEETHIERRHGFGSLEALVAFLRTEMAGTSQEATEEE
jgi:hypothetical protein